MTIRQEDVVGPDGTLQPEPLLRVLNDTLDKLTRRPIVRVQWFDVTKNTANWPQDILLDERDAPSAVLLAQAQENISNPSALPITGQVDWLWIQKGKQSFVRVRNVAGLTASTVYNLTFLVLWRD